MSENTDAISTLIQLCKEGFERGNKDYERLSQAIEVLKTESRDGKQRTDRIEETLERIQESLKPTTGKALQTELALMDSNIKRSHERHDEHKDEIHRVRSDVTAEIISLRTDQDIEILSLKSRNNDRDKFERTMILGWVGTLLLALAGIVWSMIQRPGTPK